METEAGSAYEGMSQEESQKKASSDARRRALVILRRRAETNPELADQIRAIMTRVRKNNG